MTEPYQTLEITVRDHLIEIVMNRPDTHNAIGHAMHHELKRAFLEAPGIPGARAIVFGSSGKSFSAGGDFDQMLADRSDPAVLRKLEPEAREMLMAVGDCPLPVVTALQGDAMGLGATLMLATDAVVASRTAQIADPHVVIGLAAGDGGAVVWPLSTSFLRAKRYLLTGDRIKAEDALAMGLITDLVDTPEETLPAARTLAARIAALPPLAVMATKRIMNQLFRRRMEGIFDFGIAAEMQTFASEDIVEAISSFREKRTPVFHGE